MFTTQSGALPGPFSRRVRDIGLLAVLLLAPVVFAWALPLIAGAVRSTDRTAPASGTIAIIYQESDKNDAKQYEQLADAIESRAKGRAVGLPVRTGISAGELNEGVRRSGAGVAVVLGRNGMQLASLLERDISVVVGGVAANPDSTGRKLLLSSQTPDPALMFARLKKFMPRMKRVYVVYDPRQNEWLMRHAKDSARTHGLELVAYEAQDLRSAMRAYQDILANIDLVRETLWLPQDSTTVEERAAVPLVLRAIWTRGLAVISSNPAHVGRGALFALYMDNAEASRQLADIALGLAPGGNTANSLIPARATRISINLRTATHLNVEIGDQAAYDTVHSGQE